MTSFSAWFDADVPTSEESAAELAEKIEENVDEVENVEVMVSP